MAPTLEKCAVPEIPVAAHDWISALDIEDSFVLRRKGGKQYETEAEFVRAPEPEVSSREVSNHVKSCVEATGNAYFELFSDSHKRVAWYAYAPTAMSGARSSDYDLLSPLERRCLILIDAMTAATSKSVAHVEQLAGSAVKVIEAATKSSMKGAKALRKAARETAEVSMTEVREERLRNREQMLGHFLANMGKDAKEEQDGAEKLKVLLRESLTPEDLRAIEQDETAQRMLAATSPIEFRDAAQATWQHMEAGELQLSEESIRKLAPWVQSLMGAQAEAQ